MYVYTCMFFGVYPVYTLLCEVDNSAVLIWGLRTTEVFLYGRLVIGKCVATLLGEL